MWQLVGWGHREPVSLMIVMRKNKLDGDIVSLWKKKNNKWQTLIHHNIEIFQLESFLNKMLFSILTLEIQIKLRKKIL